MSARNPFDHVKAVEADAVNVAGFADPERAAAIRAETNLALRRNFERRSEISAARRKRMAETVTRPSDRTPEEVAELRRRLDALQQTQE